MYNFSQNFAAIPLRAGDLIRLGAPYFKVLNKFHASRAGESSGKGSSRADSLKRLCAESCRSA